MGFGRGGGGGQRRGGGGRGGGRGGGGGGAFRSNRGGGGGRGFRDNNFQQGPPERIVPLGHFSYSCQDDLVVKVDIQDVPYFSAPIYLENKEAIGKIDEIFGTIRDYSVSVKLSDNMKASSFKSNQQLFIEPTKLLPIARFLPKAPQPKGPKKKGPPGGVKNQNGGRGGFGGRGRGGGGGGRGFSRGGRGGGGGNNKSGRGGRGGGGGGGGGGGHRRW
ncbi:gar1 ribonucleoprotein [Glossina fuscipes fuscipes]